jgi:hypothetical protein
MARESEKKDFAKADEVRVFLRGNMIKNFPRRAALLFGGIVLGLLLFSALPLQAESDGCALLKPADLTTLLGGTPIANPNAGACSWTVSGSTRKLIAAKLKLRTAGLTAEMAFAAARQGAAKGGKVVTEEAGLGDKAFASLESFGVALVILKQGRLLQIQYWTGGPGTAKDLGALRPVAKKAIAAF